MQPLIVKNILQSTALPELHIEKKADHLMFRTSKPFETLSSAVFGGGLKKTSHFINWKVPLNYGSTDPTALMEQKINDWGYPVDQSIGLQTAACIHSASFQEMIGDEFRMVCIVTAGVGNAARAGKPRPTFPAYQCSTINIFLFIDSSLTHSAMVNAIITATEAKAAALSDLGVLDEYDQIATGTTTDAVVIAVSQDSSKYRTHQFAGTATSIGNAIGCLVYDAVCETVRNQEVS